jgi:hypothetical protein
MPKETLISSGFLLASFANFWFGTGLPNPVLRLQSDRPITFPLWLHLN